MEGILLFFLILKEVMSSYYETDSMDSNMNQSVPAYDYATLFGYNAAGIARFAKLAPVARVSDSNLSSYQRLANTRPVVSVAGASYGGSGRAFSFMNRGSGDGRYPSLAAAYGYGPR